MSVTPQIVSLHLEPASGDAGVRPLAAPDGQEEVQLRRVQAASADGDVYRH